MRRLHDRTAEQVYAHHRDRSTPRVYEEDPSHRERIVRTRRMIARVLDGLQKPEETHRFRTVVEPGCGMADLCGAFSMGHKAIGIEANPTHAILCAKRWPHLDVRAGNIETMEPIECDLLILCETLEHLAEPHEFCKRWLPKAQRVVISCPINGDVSGQLTDDSSGGEHIWSVEEQDFPGFFTVGGHDIMEREAFQMAPYNIWLAAGKRITP